MFAVLYSSLLKGICHYHLHEIQIVVGAFYVRQKFSFKMPKPGFYAVKKGRMPGIYATWAECEAQVKGYPAASFKKFPDRHSAENFIGKKSFSNNLSKTSTNYTNQKGDFVSTCKDNVPRPSTSGDTFIFDPQPSTSSYCLIEDPNIVYNSDVIYDRQPSAAEDNMDDLFLEFENLPDSIFTTIARRETYYAVHRGRQTGVYRTWTECEAQIKDLNNTSYRKFDNEVDALGYVRTGGIVKATKRELRDIKYNNGVKKKHKSSNENPEYVLKNPDEPVVIFTDGACSQNGRKRACAGIGIYWGPDHPLNTSKRLSGRQTNNRAEIHAAIYALHQAKQIGARGVKLYTDSQFLIHSITDWVKKWKDNGWKLVTGQPVTNKDDFIELEAASQGLDVEYIYVKAHARNHDNDQADRLAVAGARLLLSPSNCSEFPKPEIAPQIVTPFIVTGASSSVEALPLIVPEEDIERKTFYAVHRGKKPGVYNTWTDCEEQIKDYIKPWFKKFTSEEEATEFAQTGKVIKRVLIPDYNPDEFVTVFTDGASSCNGQDEARAGIGVYWGPGNKLNSSMRLPGRQTNNRAEIFAAVHALKQAKWLGIRNVRLYTDSKFVINGITSWIDKWKENEWKSAAGKPVVNKEDFIVLDAARQDLNVDWCYVKGHANVPGNVEADKLAVAGCSKELCDTFMIA